MRVGIINNGLGNVGSVTRALEFYKTEVTLVKTPQALDEVDVIVLAGVGNFKTSINRLIDLRLWDKLDEEVMDNKKPVLGICLGMQLFADYSYENGKNKGFGWIEGEVVKINNNNLKVPHIGWGRVEPSEKSRETIFKGIRYNYFYFMHSYHFIPSNSDFITATMDYGDLNLIAALKKDNIVGVQFHPEKSQGDGLRLLKNFLEEVK